MTWRKISADVIEKAIPIVEQRATDTIEIFDIIRREYYPFGERKHFPYKACCLKSRRSKTVIFEQNTRLIITTGCLQGRSHHDTRTR